QAEDGIRDLYVTGVQTCALPIWPNYNEKLRFNWNTPIALSPNEKGTIYIGAQFLFRSRDHGQTWDRISPDLTTNDPEKQKQEQRSEERRVGKESRAGWPGDQTNT